MVWENREHRRRGRGKKKGEEKRGGRGEDWLVTFNLACKWIHTVERRHIGTPTFIRYTASIRATRMCSRRIGWKDRSNFRTFLSEILIQRQWACCHSSSGVWRGNTVRGRCQGGTLKAFPGCRDMDHTHHKTHGSTTSSWVHIIWADWDHCSTLSVGSTNSEPKIFKEKDRENQNTETNWIYCKTSTLLSPWGKCDVLHSLWWPPTIPQTPASLQCVCWSIGHLQLVYEPCG